MDGAKTKLTYDDYLLLPEDGMQHEIIGGEHFVNAAPNPRHQQVAARLLVQLFHQIVDTGRGEVFVSPVDVLFSPHDVVQPDLLVLLKDGGGRILETRLEGQPDLVVEILSPSTSRRDRSLKLDLYAREGVPEYWIVDPAARLLHQHVLDGKAYRLLAAHAVRFDAATVAGVSVDLDAVWC